MFDDLSAARVENSHIREAARSLNRWIERQRDIQNRSIHIAETEINDPAMNDAQRNETRESLYVLQTEQAAFERAVKRCTLAKYADDRETRGTCPDDITETRIAGSMTAAASIPLVSRSSDRATRTGTVTMTGYAARFNSVTTIANLFTESIKPGAFQAALVRSDIRLLYNHDPNYLRSRERRGLTVRQDTIGLFFSADLPAEDALCEMVVSRIQSQTLSGCSFSFLVSEDDWQLPEQPRGLPHRTLMAISEIMDIGPVVWPAYKDTSVTISSERSADSAEEDESDERKRIQDRYDGAGRQIERLRRTPATSKGIRETIERLKAARPRLVQTS